MSTLEFNNSVLQYEQQLFSFAFSFTKNKEEAQDLTQETILKAYLNRRLYTVQTNFRAWIFTIMRNLFINQYRKNVRVRKYMSDNFDSKTEIAQASTNEIVSQLQFEEIQLAIENLDNELSVPLKLIYEGFKYKEISEKLDIPIGTVKSRIFIARQKLQSILPEYALVL